MLKVSIQLLSGAELGSVELPRKSQAKLGV